jgi:hypothetical protein
MAYLPLSHVVQAAALYVAEYLPAMQILQVKSEGQR